MEIYRPTIFVLLLIARSGAKDPGCIYQCHTGPFGGSCSLEVATFLENRYGLQYPVPATIPQCKPCTVVCQERDNGYIGGYGWNLFSVEDRIHYNDNN